MKNKNLLRMILSALFLALAFVMPFLTGQIPEIGSRLCPMHIPILLCGFICGWEWGLVTGFTAPLLRSLILTMPPFYPTAICMAFELAAYGTVAGIMYRLLPKKKPFIYCSLLSSMLIGRLVWGLAMLICAGIKNNPFTVSAFLTGAFIDAVPGIIIQIVLIPIIIMITEKTEISGRKNKAS